MTAEESEESGAHGILSGVAFGIAATLLAETLALMPDETVRAGHPHAFAVAIVALPLWVVVGLLLQALAGKPPDEGVRRASRILFGVYLVLLVGTTVALGLVFASFSPEWGWAFAVGIALAVVLTATLARLFLRAAWIRT